MLKSRILLPSLVVLVSVCAGKFEQVFAQGVEANIARVPLTIVSSVVSTEAPAQASVILFANGQVGSVVPGVIIRGSNEHEYQVASRAFVSESAGPLTVLTAVTGTKGGVISTVKTMVPGGEDNNLSLTTTALQFELGAAKKRLAALESQRTLQTASLERLQEDADIIANVGRIVDAEDELGAVKSDVSRLSSAVASAQSRLGSLKELPVPTNFQRREAELTTFLNELSRSLKDSHAAALQKVASAEDEMQKKVALVESSKTEHIDLLTKELAAVRREREMLERR